MFALEQLNDRISSFDYGYGNKINYPSVIPNLRSSKSTVKEHVKCGAFYWS